MGFFENVQSFFSDAYHKVEDVVTTIYHDITGTAKYVVHTTGDTIHDLGTGVVNVANTTVQGATSAIKTISNDTSQTITSLGKNVEGVAKEVPSIISSSSMPLLVGAGALGLVLLLRK